MPARLAAQSPLEPRSLDTKLSEPERPATPFRKQPALRRAPATTKQLADQQHAGESSPRYEPPPPILIAAPFSPRLSRHTNIGPTTLVTADSITDSRNLGSGTLATVDGTKGILTAAHVLEELAVALARTVLPPSSLGQAYTKADVEQTMIGDAPQPTMSAGWGKTSKSGAMLLSRDGAVAPAPANPQRTCCPVRDGPLAINP